MIRKYLGNTKRHRISLPIQEEKKKESSSSSSSSSSESEEEVKKPSASAGGGQETCDTSQGNFTDYPDLKLIRNLNKVNNSFKAS